MIMERYTEESNARRNVIKEKSRKNNGCQKLNHDEWKKQDENNEGVEEEQKIQTIDK